MVRRTIRAMKRTLAAVKVSRRIAPIYSPVLWRMVWRAGKLYRKGRFEPVEAFRLGLLHPRSAGTEAEFVSRWELTKVQKALNPESLAHLLKDKGNFYKHCAAHELPIPKLYGLLIPQRAGWCIDGSTPVSVDEWAGCISKSMPDEFIVKPISGTLSEGFDVFARYDGGFRDTKGRQYDAKQLVLRLWGKGDGPGWVLQERLKCHPELVRLSQTEYLQTVRIVTFVDRKGGCRIANGQLRVIPGDEISDNSVVDMTGSMELPIDLARGVTGPGMQINGDGLGPHAYENHPKTGRPLVGFVIPRWEEACQLVRRAALTFLPIRSIGWDVAVTPTGLYLVEGNIWWNNGKKHAGFRQVIDRMKEEI